MIEEVLDKLQKQMELSLEEIKKSYRHCGNKGSMAEYIIRDFLRKYLPSFNRIGEGEIIDSYGNASSQLDVIIVTEDHPYLNDLTRESIFFIDGVVCAGEVKTKLNSHELNKTLEICLKYKKLKLTVPVGVIYSCKNDNYDFDVDKMRSFFLFAFKSDLKLETIVNKINEFNSIHHIDYLKQIDAIFILNRGIIINLMNSRTCLNHLIGEQEFREGLVPKKDSKVLFKFLSWLSTSAPRFILDGSILNQYFLEAENRRKRN